MKSFKIKVPLHNGKKITVTIYKKTLSGVEIKVIHNVPSTRGKQLGGFKLLQKMVLFTKHVDGELQ